MSETHIENIVGRRVWDSRGRATVEADVILAGGAMGRAIAPAGASTGSGEAVDLRDGGKAQGGLDVRNAVANVSGPIADALRGMDATDQAAVDAAMIELDGTPNKGRLGGNALVAVSMAAAHASAAAAGMPLWKYLGGADATLLPLPEIQIFGGGAHARERIDIQDFMVVCPGASSFAEACEWTGEIYLAAGKIMEERGTLQGIADEGGYWPAFATNEEGLGLLVRAIEDAGYVPGEQVAISLDIASTEFGKNGRYKLKLEDRELTSEGMIEMMLGWVETYPIVSIEDPLAEDDPDGMHAFMEAVRGKVQVVGDDFLVTSADRVREGEKLRACDALLVKPNQAGTLTETKAAFDAARAAGWGTLVSARSGETEDVTIIHLSVGWGSPQFKVGSFARSDRMAKWNEAIRIEEALGSRARFAGWSPFR